MKRGRKEKSAKSSRLAAQEERKKRRTIFLLLLTSSGQPMIFCPAAKRASFSLSLKFSFPALTPYLLILIA